ncbi:hypothetical protein C8R43DRAFT_943351 [Mycena crocata]|nr:hypothetical protein C8R43DRAFT_943351 [Mycena crocata]
MPRVTSAGPNLEAQLPGRGSAEGPNGDNREEYTLRRMDVGKERVVLGVGNALLYSRFQTFGRVLMRFTFISVGYCPHNLALPGMNGAVLVEGRLMDSEFSDVRVEQRNQNDSDRRGSPVGSGLCKAVQGLTLCRQKMSGIYYSPWKLSRRHVETRLRAVREDKAPGKHVQTVHWILGLNEDSRDKEARMEVPEHNFKLYVVDTRMTPAFDTFQWSKNFNQPTWLRMISYASGRLGCRCLMVHAVPFVGGML